MITDAQIKMAAQKEEAMKQMQELAAQMNLVAQLLDAELRLRVPQAVLQVDVLTSLLAGLAIREGLKVEQVVSNFRTKCMYARRFEKANEELKAQVPEVEPDSVAADVVAAGGVPHPDPEIEQDPAEVINYNPETNSVEVSNSRIIKP